MRHTFMMWTLFLTSFVRKSQCTCSDPGSPYSMFRESGTIQSPGFPNYYNANEECSWDLNPPVGTIPQLLITTLELETGTGYGEGATCREVDNYVTFGGNRGCDKEGPLCLAFMLNTLSDYSCHHVIMRYFPKCKSLLHNYWPLKVGFTTKDAHQMKGFQLNYTFIECRNYRPPAPEVRSTTPATTRSSVATGSITKGRATSPNIDNGQSANTPTDLNDTPIKPSLPTEGSSAKKTTTTLSTSLLAIRTTSTVIPQEGGSPQSGQFAHSTLIAVFIVLCVIFVILMVIFIFRRRIKEFTRNDKSSTNFTTSPTNNNTIKVKDNCVIALDKELAYDVIDCPNSPTSASSLYQSTDNDEIPSISSTLTNAKSDNSHPFVYNQLDESIPSTISDQSHYAQLYPTSNR